MSCFMLLSKPPPLLLLTRTLSLALNLSSSTACLACVGVGLTIHSTHWLVHLQTCTTWDGGVGGAGWWICNYKVNKGKNVRCTHLSYRRCQYGTLSTSHHHTPAGTQPSPPHSKFGCHNNMLRQDVGRGSRTLAVPQGTALSNTWLVGYHSRLKQEKKIQNELKRK